MRIKKSKLLFFFYAIIMLWPEYFSNSLTGLMANALALVGILFAFKNSKRISRFSILAAVYFVYFVVDTYFHGGGDIHTLISNMKIVISIMFVDVYLTKEDQYDTISTIFWIVFFFAMLNFATLLLFPNGMYQISTVWNEWGTTTYALYWIFGSKNSHAFWYLLLEILVGLRCYIRPSRKNKILTYLCLPISILSQMILGSSTATIATIIGAAGALSVVLFKKWNKEINAYFILCANFVFNALLIFGMTGFLGGIVHALFNKDLTFSNRTVAWGRAVTNILQRPITGTGILTSDEMKSVLGSLSFNQAHNEWLQCLWQGGIILFVILVLLLITIAGKINRIQHRNLRFMCCMFFISVFIEMAFEVWLGLVFTWLMLLLIYKAESIQSEVG